MNRRIGTTRIPAGNPLVNALMVIAGALALGAMIVVGLVAFLVVASIIIVLAGIVGIRVWWHRRKLKDAFGAGSDAGRKANDARIIEGEYRSISTRSDRERQGFD